MGEWKTYVLEEIIDKFIDYRGKTPKKTLSGVPLITAKIVKNGRLLPPNEFISKEDYLSWMTRGFPQMNDVVLTTEAPLGEVALIQDENVALAQRIITLKTNKKICDSIFLKYYLQSDEGQALLLSRASGSTVEGIKAAELKKIIVTIPNLSTQKRISSILFHIDNKISLLHHQNTTLEKMAETIFRQWFIEEAKEDWEEKKLSEIIELVGGGTPKTAIIEYWNGNIKWLSGGDIANNHKTIITNSEKFITQAGLTNSSAKLLPKYATVISARGTVGKYCILAEPMAFSQSNYGILPRYPNCFFFTYLVINHSVNLLQSSVYGSVFDTITTKTFKEHSISIPKDEVIIYKFEERVACFFKKIESNQQQIQILTQLRDTLLPKLMSGEIKVTD